MREAADRCGLSCSISAQAKAHRKAPRESISALALREDSLFLGATRGSCSTGSPHRGRPCVALGVPILDLLDLPNRTGEDDEIDIEGMDIEGDVLWLVGSHGPAASPRTTRRATSRR